MRGGPARPVTFFCFDHGRPGWLTPALFILDKKTYSKKHKDFEDVSKFGNVIKEFKKAGLSEEEIRKICYKNLERVILKSLK